MNGAQIHLALTHFPIAGCFAFVFLIWGLLSQKTDIKHAAIFLIILSAVVVIPLYLSGEYAEKVVEHKPLVTEEVIKPHEEAGQLALAFLEISALLGISWVVMKKRNIVAEKWVYSALIGSMAVSAILIARTAHFGGQIRHDEIRNGAVVNK